MKLVQLVGEHVLDGVDFFNDLFLQYGEDFAGSNVLRFRLDGVVYVAAEDPCDGYRSTLADVFVREGATMRNVFAPVKVRGRWRGPNSNGTEDDILELLDAKTGRVVLEVGTDNSADYYPGFVASFHPEAMACNASREYRNGKLF